MDWNTVKEWFLSFGEQYNVNPIIFGAIYIGAIPFFMLVIGRRPKAPRIPVAPVPAETIERRPAIRPAESGLSALPGEEGFDIPS
ncbi:MAG: hypothetical protein IH840_11775 [Candidatus Heimdallarchaeota archaeon]|nr:hypothetical protein [Candidatus Heimdallarchaeota archaeon]